MKAGTEERREWAIRHDRCWVCGAKNYRGFPLETHEIERRSHAAGRWAHPCNYLLVCNACHAETIPTMSHAMQLAIKWMNDPTNFDLDVWLRLRDPELTAPERVTMEDVEACF